MKPQRYCMVAWVLFKWLCRWTYWILCNRCLDWLETSNKQWGGMAETCIFPSSWVFWVLGSAAQTHVLVPRRRSSQRGQSLSNQRVQGPPAEKSWMTHLLMNKHVNIESDIWVLHNPEKKIMECSWQHLGKFPSCRMCKCKQWNQHERL